MSPAGVRSARRQRRNRPLEAAARELRTLRDRASAKRARRAAANGSKRAAQRP